MKIDIIIRRYEKITENIYHRSELLLKHEKTFSTYTNDLYIRNYLKPTDFISHELYTILLLLGVEFEL